MGSLHQWYGTNKDAWLILDWIEKSGARYLIGNRPRADYTEQVTIVFHYPNCGPIKVWEDPIDPAKYADNSPMYKRAVLAKMGTEGLPAGTPILKTDDSPVVVLELPYLVRGRFWCSGELSFPAFKLKEQFPALYKTCQSFGRWLSKFPVAFKWNGSERASPYEFFTLDPGGICCTLHALPDAESLLHSKRPMVFRGASEARLDQFERDLKRREISF